MIKESYVSFETAKLLKEKGFDAECYTAYNSDGKLKYGTMPVVKSEIRHLDYILAPTHQMACAWLRSKGYSIEVYSTAIGWHWQICKVNGTSIAFADLLLADGKNEGGAWDDYDECTEAAIKYSLENLI